MDRFDPFVKYADVYGDIINWEKDPMNKPQNQNKYFFSDGKTYYEQICKMLRLMSVFKEAFNQIYNNEDEISEAWENFVNNLSASVVEGSEPDVTLTWTDDSVNFEFTMVPGVPGDPGVGITSISFNSDYTMTITLSDGSTYTSMSLKGDTGPQGPQGETGSGLQILDVYATLADLQSAHPTGQPGDAYQVGSGGSYTLYIWSSSQSAWIPAGSLGTVSPSTSNPLMDGTASAGSSDLYSRGDHVHPSDTSRASQEELDSLIKTSQALIDQSFTYRESPAIQDGLARFDKIKGNTLVWNQKINTVASKTADGITTSFDSATGLFSIRNDSRTTNFSSGSNSNTLVAHADCVAGHKYLINTDKVIEGITIHTGSEQAYLPVILTYNGNGGFYIRITAAYDFVSVHPVGDVTSFHIYIVDLTQMFGAGNEPATLEEFTSLFPLPHYDYNEGSLLNFNGTGLKTVGFNQWDEEWEVGEISTTNGENVEGSNIIRSKNYIPVFPNMVYYFKTGNTAVNTYRHFYDADKNYLGYVLANTNSVLTTPANAHYMRFRLGTAYGATYKNDICINISDSSKNGTYEPYTSSTLSLPISTYFPTGMKNAGNAHDELTDSKAITRIGQVDLGDLVWRYVPVNTRFEANMPSNYKTPTSVDNRQNMICDRYPTNSNPLTGNAGNGITGYQNSILVYVKDESFTDVSAFTTAVTGSILYYELATPVETAVDLDLDFMAYENGTEQLLPVNGSVPATSPVIADMAYLSIDDAMEYIIDKLANVPLNTQQILDALEDDVADLQEDVGALQPAVSDLQTSVGNINTNIGQLSSTVAGHTSSISDIQSDISDLNTGLSDLGDTVTNNTSRIGTLETDLSTTDGQVQNLETSVSDLGDTVTAQGATVTALDDIISDISNNPVNNALGNHELGFVLASVEATLPANTGTMVTIPKPTIFPNNYTPLFIVGMTTGSYNVSICSIPNTFGTGNSVTCRVWNHGSQQTTQISVYILCMRQKQSQ